jgi:hypothetical protein
MRDDVQTLLQGVVRFNVFSTWRIGESTRASSAFAPVSPNRRFRPQIVDQEEQARGIIAHRRIA